MFSINIFFCNIGNVVNVLQHVPISYFIQLPELEVEEN